MALTAQLDVETPSGDGDTSLAIDPAFWQANQGAIQGYAKADGVTLYYQDTKRSATSTEGNINTLSDAKGFIDEAASISVTVGGAPIKADAPAPASTATLGGQPSSAAGPLLGLAAAGLLVVIAWAGSE